MDVFTTPLLTGTATGAILLLAALGLSLTFGQMGVINMANGEFLMAGAYVAYLTQQVVTSVGLSTVVAIPAAFVIAGLLGVLLEVTLIQWMYRRPLDTLLVTVGVSLILQQLARDLFGAQGDPVRPPSWMRGSIDVFGYAWPHRQLFTIILALGCMAGLSAVLRFSSFGRQIRATVQNRDLAETLGVSSRRIDRITFFLGSGLAGLGGVAVALISGTNSTLGTSYIIPAFLVVVAGQSVAFPNDDRMPHNVFSVSPARPFDLGHYRQGESRTVLFDRPGIVDVFCNIHDNMIGWILITDAGWFGRSADDGSWHAVNLPGGNYELTVWHPRLRDAAANLLFRVHVDGGTTARVDFRSSKPMRPAPLTGKSLEWDY
mgnify:CR=1 FL=1